MGQYQPYHYRKRDGCREEMEVGGDNHVNEQQRRSGGGKVAASTPFFPESGRLELLRLRFPQAGGSTRTRSRCSIRPDGGHHRCDFLKPATNPAGPEPGAAVTRSGGHGRSDGGSVSYQTILPDRVSKAPGAMNAEEGGRKRERRGRNGNDSVEDGGGGVEEASTRDAALVDPSTLRRFVSPVAVDDYSGYLRTAFMNQKALRGSRTSPVSSTLLSSTEEVIARTEKAEEDRASGGIGGGSPIIDEQQSSTASERQGESLFDWAPRWAPRRLPRPPKPATNRAEG
ncbi:hypothetical protein GW17_00008439 [Ensete ventricosum]|nr:hypothetical protein GW17_00008439 [Ensete ventricosum]